MQFFWQQGFFGRIDTPGGNGTMDEPCTEKESATVLAQLKELVTEAKSGNPEVLPQIR